MGTPDLSTRYLGMDLSGPLIASSSPMTRHLETMQELEAAGASAVVLPSLFEEDARASESTSLEARVALVKQAKDQLSIPVIASLNATRPGTWQDYAEALVGAGADALELNLYAVTADISIASAEVEMEHLAAIEAVKIAVEVPLAVKLSSYYSAISSFAARAVDAGADGLVLFNRFYAADIDLNTLQLHAALDLSIPADQRLALRWIGILRAQLPTTSLACTSGVHSGAELTKAILVGADVACTASAVMQRGAGAVTEMLNETSAWLSEHDFASVSEARGKMSASSSRGSAVYERAQYLDVIKGEW
ncbi:MAG TPA: dihydroorotate dehydrogenase [Propionibacteriaceae bacterium]|nr:dihydroorotate dehydrogenase [Propionibacteriaceae bacterium]